MSREEDIYIDDSEAVHGDIYIDDNEAVKNTYKSTNLSREEEIYIDEWEMCK